MSQPTIIRSLNHFLYRFRGILAASSLVFVLFYIVYMWFYVPYEDFTAIWRPDSHLVVLNVPEDSVAAPFLQSDDRVLEVGGQPVQRMRTVYPLPLRSVYEYTVRRGSEIFSAAIPFQLRLPPTLLTLT